jgi:hypothetical protein
MLSHRIKLGTSPYNAEIDAYGIYSFKGSKELNWSNPRGDSIVMPADVDADGYDDLLIWDKPSLFLYTTSPYKYGCNEQPSSAAYSTCYESIKINPSTANTWCGNSSAEITILFYDYDNSGKLQANVELYADDANSQNTTWQGNFSNGESRLFATYGAANQPFIANKTGTYKLVIKIRDLDKPTQVNTITKYFTVANTESCITSSSGIIETVGGGAPAGSTPTLSATQPDINSIKTFLDEFSGYTHFGTSLLYFIVVAIIFFAIIFMDGIGSIALRFAVAYAATGICTFLGVLLQLVSWVYLLVFIFIGIGALAIAMSKIFFGESNTGGG